MAVYQWAPAGMTEVFILPAAVVDEALRLASVEQLQVLMWFSRNRGQWDAAACAAALGYTPAACESHLRFWLQQGLLQEAGAPAAAAQPEKRVRPAAVKPRLEEVVAYQKEHRDFVAFVEEVSARLGKPLSHGDVATLLYLTTTAGIPQQSVVLIACYAVSRGKPSVRYVETVALNWADEDILQPDAVDGRIREMREQQESADRVQTLLGLPAPLNSADAKRAHKWLKDWNFSDEMLKLAKAETEEKAKKFSLAYMDKILESWFIGGIDAPEKVTQARPKKKGVAATNPEESSLDTEGFEEQLLQYRPKYKKK